MADSGDPDLWRLFEKTLMLTLADLTEVSYLIISTAGPDPEHERYVQFARFGDGLRVETAADVFLPDDAKLSPGDRDLLARIGFHAPTVAAERAAGGYDSDEGSANWFKDFSKSPDIAAAAAMAVKTLQAVHGVGSPAELRYESFREDGTEIRLPELGVGHCGGDVVWGWTLGGELVFILRRRAEDLAALWSALGSADTWGDLRRSLPPRLFRETVDACWGADEPDDDDAFSSDSVAVIADGDYPGIPTQEVFSWMPPDILETYGNVGMSMVSGPLVSFDAEEAEAIVAALEKHGFTTTRDDDLISGACGW